MHQKKICYMLHVCAYNTKYYVNLSSIKVNMIKMYYLMYYGILSTLQIHHIIIFISSCDFSSPKGI